ncbi:MAG TPA: NADH-quinone oxidoreductase subunit C [Synergistales bacterium]|jgi:membrane-bound hydrogenase subunit beta|nr:NADH-quinone oxidoreductase subunit C [Synergistales bacterium]HRV71563.1 NADH-quinone oxidoreductase subunit C [Thermovirgaceae bacterium]
MKPRCPEYVKESMDPKQVEDCIREKFGDAVRDVELRDHKGGAKNKVAFKHLWLTIDRKRFTDLVDALMEIDFLHFHITSGDDVGNAVQLNYHFSIFRSAGYGRRLGITVTVDVPKKDLVMPSLWSRIPGIEYSEREIREMLGVDFDGLPNKALIFLPEDWNEEIKPWRRDETGPKPEDIRELS